MSQNPSTFLDALLMKLIQNNGSLMPTRSALNFLNGTLVDNPSNDSTDFTAPSSGGGGSSFTVTVGNNADVNLASATGNQFVGFENLTAGHAVTLPTAPTVGQQVIIKDLDGSLATEAITLTPGSFTIDGVSSFVMSLANGFNPKSAVTLTFVSNALGWAVS